MSDPDVASMSWSSSLLCGDVSCCCDATRKVPSRDGEVSQVWLTGWSRARLASARLLDAVVDMTAAVRRDMESGLLRCDDVDRR